MGCGEGGVRGDLASFAGGGYSVVRAGCVGAHDRGGVAVAGVPVDGPAHGPIAVAAGGAFWAVAGVGGRARRTKQVLRGSHTFFTKLPY